MSTAQPPTFVAPVEMNQVAEIDASGKYHPGHTVVLLVELVASTVNDELASAIGAWWCYCSCGKDYRV